MWFKNLQIMAVTESAGYQPEQLAEELSGKLFQPCSNVTPASLGWVAPIGGEGAPLVYGANGMMMLCLKLQHKVLPAAVLREQLAQQVVEQEEAEGRALYKKEKAQMKETLYYQLLAQAFVQSTRVYAYIDTINNWMLVDAASLKTLDQFVEIFSEHAKSWAIERPELNSIPALMTKWLKSGRLPKRVHCADACVLEDLSERRGVVRVRNKDLQSDNVLAFLREGAQVMQMSLEWHEQLRFALKDDFSFTGLKFLEGVQDQARAELTESPEERFAADFLIMAETLRHFMADFMPYCLAEAGDAEAPAEAPVEEEEAVAAVS